MKLRIQGNSIRLRLTRSEVDQMQREGRVDAAVAFPDGARLGYSLRSASAFSEVTAEFTDERIAINVPEAILRQWASTDEVSIAASQQLGQGGTLALLVEKDFACLAPREGEDDSDMFPHPLEDDHGSI